MVFRRLDSKLDPTYYFRLKSGPGFVGLDGNNLHLKFPSLLLKASTIRIVKTSKNNKPQGIQDLRPF